MARVFLLFCFISLLPTITSTIIGLNYKTNTYLPAPGVVVAKFKELKLSSVRLPFTDRKITKAFIDSNIALSITLPNNLIPSISSDCYEAEAWIDENIHVFYPRVKFSGVSVGIDVFNDNDDRVSQGVVRAISCIQELLAVSGLSEIQVSTTLTYENMFNCSAFPSQCNFRPGLLFLGPLLRQLVKSKSPLFLDMNPYKWLKFLSEKKEQIAPFNFFIFDVGKNDFIRDPYTNKNYSNVFDVMIDNVIHAMASMHIYNIPIVITSTGWPTYDQSFDGATEAFSEKYLEGLVKHVRRRKRDLLPRIFLDEFLDTNDTYKWGISSPDMRMKFNLNLSSDGSDPIITTYSDLPEEPDINLTQAYHNSINGMLALLTVFVAVVFVRLFNRSMTSKTKTAAEES